MSLYPTGKKGGRKESNELMLGVDDASMSVCGIDLCVSDLQGCGCTYGIGYSMGC